MAQSWFEQKSDPTKLLGITLDTTLNWECHIDKLCSQVSSQIFAMRQLRSSISDNNVMRVIYFAIIHSRITYGTALWGNASSAHKIFKLQKTAVRIVDAAGRNEHCRDLFKKYRILPLPCIYIY
ncbi:hypothetical protein NQ317_017094 [Molorchus minor]|uniref:RNA-directed DNA polymerase n=1 Tax=Molorchus minor TaxID=1323400 RepID=A0ABQ9JHN2_9CUCU|nr:hypothetical protein NQ317_017094 [Molorchus minor]